MRYRIGVCQSGETEWLASRSNLPESVIDFHPVASIASEADPDDGSDLMPGVFGLQRGGVSG